MRSIESLSHTRWECKYHIVFIPKYRKKAIFGQIRKELGDVFRRLARQKESVIEEGHLMPDHVHMMISIPPKYAVSDVVGRIKGQTASMLRKKFEWLDKVYWKENIVWSPGYFVATVGLDEKMILNYVKYQEHQDSGQAQLVLL